MRRSREARSPLFPTLLLTPAQLIISLNLKFPFLNTLISPFSFLLNCFLHLVVRSSSAPKLLLLRWLPAVAPADPSWAGEGLSGHRWRDSASCWLLLVLLVPVRATQSCPTAATFENLVTAVHTAGKEAQKHNVRSAAHTPQPRRPGPAAPPKLKSSSREGQEAGEKEPSAAASPEGAKGTAGGWGSLLPSSGPPLPGTEALSCSVP